MAQKENRCRQECIPHSIAVDGSENKQASFGKVDSKSNQDFCLFLPPFCIVALIMKDIH